ncbi:LPS export ABC transporter permease LptG [Prosthecomicrobium sp. N25]|uniref:LPS export ABC transporter permease LptG n=1 Tax=Prosthecomicrobium sp. N25 TaxID=3129254 RepID=UPI0030771AE4
MIGRTLGFYIARRFARSILLLFLFSAAIIFLFDFLELFRRSVDRPGVTTGLVVAGSLLRVPWIAEQTLPFATLFGSMAAFLGLSRSLELVVARAAGVSVWQFTMPALLVALGIGVVGTVAYNPLAAYAKERADEIAMRIFGRDPRLEAMAATDTWLRQDGPQGESILHARRALDQGARLGDVTVMSFDKTGRFQSRIDAAEARFADGVWILSDARVRREGAAPLDQPVVTLPTYLTLEQIRERAADPDTVPFWALDDYIELARNAGLPAFRYELQYQTLVARPLLLAAMVLIAGTVSLHVFRFGNVGRLILGGVTAGFVLYVVGEVARDLGGVGLVPPVLAAWTPALVASLMGFTILLYREDG